MQLSTAIESDCQTGLFIGHSGNGHINIPAI
jgi:hypothetical protein